MRRLLPRLTLILIDCHNYVAAEASLKNSLSKCKFGSAKFFTDRDIRIDGVETVIIPPIRSKEEYSYFVVKELWKHFDTDFVLITQHDGVVMDPNAWDDSFMDYSYIGAPWVYGDQHEIGNGGFSLRSKELHWALGNDPLISSWVPEDACIGRTYRHHLEQKHGMRFPSVELADRFSYELREPTGPTFGRHANFHQPWKPNIIITRSGACGDVLAIEPLLRHLHNLGNKVFLNTSSQFDDLFEDHDFPVYCLRKGRDERVPFTHFNLDGTYEQRPKQLHLLSYFQFCGIPHPPAINRPVLQPVAPPMFEKYVVLHLDKRPQPHRNIRGVSWNIVVDYLKERGYTVFQIGQSDDRIETSAIRLQTHTLHMLKYIVSGASLFVGIDSGPSHIAVAYGVKSIILSGSVDLRYIHPDMSGISWIHNHDKPVCEKEFCWHSAVTTEGVPCYVDDEKPPCSNFKGSEKRVIKAIEKWIEIEK